MAQNLTDNWQIDKILTDNWHLPPPSRPSNINWMIFSAASVTPLFGFLREIWMNKMMNK